MTSIIAAITKIIEFVEGKKTYIGGAIIGIAAFLKAIGAIDQQTYSIAEGAGMFVMAFGIRMAIKNLEKKIK